MSRNNHNVFSLRVITVLGITYSCTTPVLGLLSPRNTTLIMSLTLHCSQSQAGVFALSSETSQNYL